MTPFRKKQRIQAREEDAHAAQGHEDDSADEAEVRIDDTGSEEEVVVGARDGDDAEEEGEEGVASGGEAQLCRRDGMALGPARRFKDRYARYRKRVAQIQGSQHGSVSTMEAYRDHQVLGVLSAIGVNHLANFLLPVFLIRVGCLVFWAMDLPDAKLPPWFRDLFEVRTEAALFMVAELSFSNCLMLLIERKLSTTTRMQASDAFNELRGMVCTRLHFRPASASLMDDDGSTSTDQELSQQQIEDILLRIDEEKAGCCEAAVPAFLLAFPGSSTIEAVGRFMEENHDRISAADVLKLAERFDEMKSSDKHGSFEALSKACLERLLMAASHDTLTKDIAPLLWPGRDVVEIKCKSRMDRTDIFLSDGSEWCVQSKRCIIKQRGSCVALCDAIARSEERCTCLFHDAKSSSCLPKEPLITWHSKCCAVVRQAVSVCLRTWADRTTQLPP